MALRGVMPAAAGMESVPSLELLESDDDSADLDLGGPGGPTVPTASRRKKPQISMGDLVQVISEMREHLLQQGLTPMKRKDSIFCKVSQNSVAGPGVSNSGRKLQVPNENLAMQALVMDISSLVPIRAPRRKGTWTSPKSAKMETAGTTSLNLAGASMGLSAMKKKKDKDKQKSPGTLQSHQVDHHVDQTQRHQVVHHVDQAQGQKGHELSHVDQAQHHLSSSRPESERAESETPRQSPRPSNSGDPRRTLHAPDGEERSSGQCLELPNSMVKQGSSEVLGPLEESIRKDETLDKFDQRQSLVPASTAERSEVMKLNESRDSVQRVASLNSRPMSPASPRKNGSSVISIRSDGKKMGSLHSSREGSLTQRSRRSSCDLNRAVSKANITEVFKVREMELTADLSSKTSQGRKPKPQRPQERLSAVLTDEDTGSEPDSDSQEEEAEEELEEEPSIWLNFSLVNTLITGPVSKMLGLVPLFAVVTDEKEKNTWKSFCKQLTSRLYHWTLLLFLLYRLVLNVQALSVCHMGDEGHFEDAQYDQCFRVWWPPMAVDTALLIGVILVLMSWGGIFKYQETSELVTQSSEELGMYMEKNYLGEAWKSWSCKDALWTVLLWFFLVAARWAPILWKVDLQNVEVQVGFKDIQMVFWHTFLIGILLVASFWQVRTSHAMLLIVNSWSVSLLRQEISCMEAKRQWRRVSGLFRKISRTFEHCFAALASLILFLALMALYDLLQGRDLQVVGGVAVVICVLPGVLWTHASTTTACNRLPSLVTLYEVEDEEQDAEYMALAMYLSLSECGFFVWDTCVTVAFVQKFLYFASALAGTIGFQTGAFTLT